MYLNQSNDNQRFTKEQARNWIEQAATADTQFKEDIVDVIEESNEPAQKAPVRKTDPIIDSTPTQYPDPDDIEELVRLVKEIEETNLIGFIDTQPEKDTFFDELLSVDAKRSRIDSRT